jgi:hypothetical protein
MASVATESAVKQSLTQFCLLHFNYYNEVLLYFAFYYDPTISHEDNWKTAVAEIEAGWTASKDLHECGNCSTIRDRKTGDIKRRVDDRLAGAGGEGSRNKPVNDIPEAPRLRTDEGVENLASMLRRQWGAR